MPLKKRNLTSLENPVINLILTKSLPRMVKRKQRKFNQENPRQKLRKLRLRKNQSFIQVPI